MNLEERVDCHIYVVCNIEMLFHIETGEEITIPYDSYLYHHLTDRGVKIYYSANDVENDPHTQVVAETLEETDAIVNEARRQYKDVINNWTAIRK